jgi:two-component system cell cycle response regulator DivK
VVDERHVLIVEDNILNLKLFELLLRGAGFGVVTATNADDALAAIARHRPDLILMDVQLPGLDGLALTRLVRSDDANRVTRIVAITAYALSDDRARALAAGCDGFIAKPIDTRAFCQTVAGYLGESL